MNHVGQQVNRVDLRIRQKDPVGRVGILVHQLAEVRVTRAGVNRFSLNLAAIVKQGELSWLQRVHPQKQ